MGGLSLLGIFLDHYLRAYGEVFETNSHLNGFLWGGLAALFPWILGLRPQVWPVWMTFPLISLSITCLIFEWDETFVLFGKDMYLPFFVLSFLGGLFLLVEAVLPELRSSVIQRLGTILTWSAWAYLAVGLVYPLVWIHAASSLGVILAGSCFWAVLMERKNPNAAG